MRTRRTLVTTAFRRRTAEPDGRFTAALVAIALAGFLLLPQQIRGDDAVRVRMLQQMAEGIKPESKFSFIQPAVSTPLFWVFDHLGFGVFAVTLVPVVWMTVWSVTTWRVLAARRSAAFAHHTVVLTIVSLLGAYLVGFGSDVFTALGMSGGLICGLMANRRGSRVAAWAIFVVAAANTPTMVAAAAVIALYLVLSSRTLRYALLPVCVLAAMVVESTLVTGHLSWTRYSDAQEFGNVQLLPWGDVRGFGWPMWSGVVAILFSFGRGLVFYVPLLWNAPMRGGGPVVRAERSLWAAVIVLLPIYGTWWAWYGGVSFGPRFFMLAVVPAAMATSAVVCSAHRSTARSLVCLATVLVSLWVAFAGAVFGVTTTAFDWCASGGGFNNEALCLYTPEYSGLWAPIWTGEAVGLRDALFLLALICCLVPTLLSLAVIPWRSARSAIVRANGHLRESWSL